MTVQQRPSRKMRVGVEYGIGGSHSALFSRDDLAGKTALEVLRRVIDSPQSPGSETRTARVVADALSTMREIDLELVASVGGKAEGEPIGLDHVIVADDGGEIEENAAGQQQEEIRIRLSESYRGGVAR